MEHWAKTVAKNGGVAAVTIQEGADRLRELETELAHLHDDLERFTGGGLLDCHAICDQRDAAVAERDRLRAENESSCKVLRQDAEHNAARAEKAEAALAASRYETVQAAQEGLRECIRAEKAEERLKWLEGFLQAGGTSINTVSHYTVENHPDDTDETHFNFPFQIGISVETENRGCYEWVEFSNGAKGLCPAIDAAKIKYAEWQNKMHKGD
jgi:hypothetical protein